jgi:molecular chaperone GrpE (heat shock protein)
MKQETLEEAAERILANNIDGLRDALKDDDLFFFYKGVIQCYGEAMAEWQKQNSYSEEDMKKAFNSSSLTNMLDVYDSFEEFIEQFKNK